MIGTAVYGIRVILDFEGISGRAHSMAQALQASIDGWHAGTHDAKGLHWLSRRCANAMLDDVTSWRLLAEGRRLAVPG